MGYFTTFGFVLGYSITANLKYFCNHVTCVGGGIVGLNKKPIHFVKLSSMNKYKIYLKITIRYVPLSNLLLSLVNKKKLCFYCKIQEVFCN